MSPSTQFFAVAKNWSRHRLEIFSAEKIILRRSIKNIFLLKNFLTTSHSPSLAPTLRLGPRTQAHPGRKCYPALSSSAQIKKLLNGSFFICAEDRGRTGDPSLFRGMLYQLSYLSIFNFQNNIIKLFSGECFTNYSLLTGAVHLFDIIFVFSKLNSI